jgi:hypothetical protein
MDNFRGRKSSDFSLELGFTPHPRFHGNPDYYTHCALLYKHLGPVSGRLTLIGTISKVQVKVQTFLENGHLLWALSVPIVFAPLLFLSQT